MTSIQQQFLDFDTTATGHNADDSATLQRGQSAVLRLASTQGTFAAEGALKTCPNELLDVHRWLSNADGSPTVLFYCLNLSSLLLGIDCLIGTVLTDSIQDVFKTGDRLMVSWQPSVAKPSPCGLSCAICSFQFQA